MNSLEYLPFAVIAAKFKRCMTYSVKNPNHPDRSFTLFLNMEDLTDCTFYIGSAYDDKKDKNKIMQKLDGLNHDKEVKYILDVMRNLLASKHITEIDSIYNLKPVEESCNIKSGLARFDGNDKPTTV